MGSCVNLLCQMGRRLPASVRIAINTPYDQQHTGEIASLGSVYVPEERSPSVWAGESSSLR
jgi:hypothetical protein